MRSKFNPIQLEMYANLVWTVYSYVIFICLNNGRYYTPSADQLFYKIFRQSSLHAFVMSSSCKINKIDSSITKITQIMRNYLRENVRENRVKNL